MQMLLGTLYLYNCTIVLTLYYFDCLDDYDFEKPTCIRRRVCLPLRGDLVVEEVETLRLGAVNVEPPDHFEEYYQHETLSSPIADEILLVEKAAIGAEE